VQGLHTQRREIENFLGRTVFTSARLLMDARHDMRAMPSVNAFASASEEFGWIKTVAVSDLDCFVEWCERNRYSYREGFGELVKLID
jgi:hypothetical protein